MAVSNQQMGLPMKHALAGFAKAPARRKHAATSTRRAPRRRKGRSLPRLRSDFGLVLSRNISLKKQYIAIPLLTELEKTLPAIRSNTRQPSIKKHTLEAADERHDRLGRRRAARRRVRNAPKLGEEHQNAVLLSVTSSPVSPWAEKLTFDRVRFRM
jgi:hypothetical protein